MFKSPSYDLLSKKNDFFIEKFSTILANTYLVYLKTQNYHWNVKGPYFYVLHKVFDNQYKALADAVDSIAERIRMLDSVAPASFNEFLKLTILSDGSPTPDNSEDMLHNLLKDHMLIVADIKSTLKISANYDDESSKDLLIQRLAAHEKIVWEIKSNVKDFGNINTDIV